MTDITFVATPSWHRAHPNTFVGILVLDGVENMDQSAGLDACKGALETSLRAAYAQLSRAELRALPTLQAYEGYYRRFQKTYHVQLQLESVVLKGKPIPQVTPLVEAMFMAELKNQLLTAGHDLATLVSRLRLDVATGSEVYVLYNGQEQQVKAGDMYVADQRGIISNVIYGPDQRTRITEMTRTAFFTVYGVPGISRVAIEQHLADIVANVQLVSPSARITMQETFGDG